jgi:hypothetical protein
MGVNAALQDGVLKTEPSHQHGSKDPSAVHRKCVPSTEGPRNQGRVSAVREFLPRP